MKVYQLVHDASWSFSKPRRFHLMINTQLVSEISAIPTISSGNLLSDKTFELNLNIRKYSGELSKKSYYLWRSPALIETSSEIKFRSFSPGGETLLIGRNSGDKDCFIEIWKDKGSCFISSINVSNIHGNFCTDGKQRNRIYVINFLTQYRGFWLFFMES